MDISVLRTEEATLQKYSYEKMFYLAALLKSYFGMDVLLNIYSTFSEHLSLRTSMKGYSCL